MKVYIVRRIIMFGDGSSHTLPLALYEHSEDAKQAVNTHNQGTAAVMGWPIVSPEGQTTGALGQFLSNLGVMRIGYDSSECEVRSSALLVPEKRIIVPGN